MPQTSLTTAGLIPMPLRRLSDSQTSYNPPFPNVSIGNPGGSELDLG